MPVLQPEERLPVQIPATGRLPRLGGQQDRHPELLRPRCVHLLADDPFDPADRTQTERQGRVDARSHLADERRAQQQTMRGDLRVGGIVAQGGREQGREPHGGSGYRSRSALVIGDDADELLPLGGRRRVLVEGRELSGLQWVAVDGGVIAPAFGPVAGSYVADPAWRRSCVSAVEFDGIVATHAERNSSCGSLARLYVTNRVPLESVATVGHPRSTSVEPITPLRARTEFAEVALRVDLVPLHRRLRIRRSGRPA